MDSGGLCDDPVDISMLILKLASKCIGGEMGFAFYLARAAIGISLDGFEMLVLYTSVLQEYTEDNMGLSIGLILGICAISIAALIIVGCMAVPVLTIANTDKQRSLNKFFLTFKTVNLTIALLVLAGTIYGRENIDTEKTEQIVMLVFLGLDLLFDPIELILGCCKFCRG